MRSFFCTCGFPCEIPTLPRLVTHRRFLKSPSSSKRVQKNDPYSTTMARNKKNALVSLNTTRFTTHFGEHCLVIPFCGCFCGFSSSVPAPRPSRRRRTKNENLQAKESDSAHKKGGKNTKTQRKKPKLPNNLGGAMRWKRK